MTKRRIQKDVEIETLVARIENVRTSYSIAVTRLTASPHHVDDEAILEIVGRIEQVSDRHKHYVGELIGITLICAQRYHEQGESEGGPLLVEMTLKAGQRAAMAYLPPASFWNLPSVLEGGDSYVQAHFERVRYGSGRLVSLNFGSIEAMLQ